MNASSYKRIWFSGTTPLCATRRSLQGRCVSVKTLGSTCFTRRLLATAAATVLVLVVEATAQTTASTPPAAKASEWKFGMSVAIKETFDSNVYLQSETDLADQASFVTSLLPQLSAAWNPAPLFGATLTYSPEATWFHAEPSEDFVAHRATLVASGKQARTAWDSTTSLVFIDGDSEGLVWGPHGAPAAGGPAVRDRRDAAVYRSSLRVTQSLGKWFVRPAASLYFHDFQTEHRATKGYLNFVDRSEITAGADIGRQIPGKLSASVGYRYGLQNQAKLLAFPEEYDSTFHRVLFGIEGTPASWVKLSFIVGPEFRRYGNDVPASFGDRDELNLFVDVSATFTLTKVDTLTLSVKQFEQPGFGGRSTYEDLTYDLTYRHKFNQRWTAGLGGRAYNTDFLDPTTRNDWVLSANTFVNCAINSHLSAEASYVFEQGSSLVASTTGRDYERHLVSLGIKYVFQ